MPTLPIALSSEVRTHWQQAFPFAIWRGAKPTSRLFLCRYLALESVNDATGVFSYFSFREIRLDDVGAAFPPEYFALEQRQPHGLPEPGRLGREFAAEVGKGRYVCAMPTRRNPDILPPRALIYGCSEEGDEIETLCYRRDPFFGTQLIHQRMPIGALVDTLAVDEAAPESAFRYNVVAPHSPPFPGSEDEEVERRIERYWQRFLQTEAASCPEALIGRFVRVGGDRPAPDLCSITPFFEQKQVLGLLLLGGPIARAAARERLHYLAAEVQKCCRAIKAEVVAILKQARGQSPVLAERLAKLATFEREMLEVYLTNLTPAGGRDSAV